MPTPSAAVQRLTFLLKGVKQTTTGWVASCPSHDDKVQSLSIGVGHEGRAIVKCHAGCPVEAVVSAIGLTLTDLFVEPIVPITHSSEACSAAPRDVVERKVVAEYVYLDENGAPVYCVRRYDPKTFRRFHADGRGGWAPGTEGCKTLLYRLPELIGATAVVIVEGEKDVDRLCDLGLRATTAGGATAWKPELVEQLKWAGVKHVAVIPDNDGPGLIGASRVGDDCHAAGFNVRLVNLPGLPDKGDVSDWLDQGHTADDLRDQLNTSLVYTGGGSLSDARSPTRTPILTKLSTVRAERIDWLWPQRLARRKITLWAGDPGGGKSYASLDIAARLSRGMEFPDGSMAERGRTLILAAEDGVSDTIAARVEALSGDTERIHVMEGFREGEGPGQIWSLRHVDMLDAALEQTKADLVIIDPLMAYMGKTDTFKDSDIRGAMAPLVPMIERHNASLLVIMHLNKNDKSRAIYRVGGSVAFVGLARLGFLFGHDPEIPGRRVMAPVKANICQAAPSWAFRITDQGVEWEAHSCYLDASQILKEPTHEQVQGEADSGGWDTVCQQKRGKSIPRTPSLGEGWGD